MSKREASSSEREHRPRAGVKTRTCVLAPFLLGTTLSAHAADWYNDVGIAMGRVEQWSDGSIYLMVPSARNGAPVTLQGASTSCSVTQIHLIPPSGKEKEWLAMVLAATMSGKSVNVFGDCVVSSYRIDANRLVVEY